MDGTFTPYVKIGRLIADNWGIKHSESEAEAVKALTPEAKQLCMLSAILHELCAIKEVLKNPQPAKEKKPPRPKPPEVNSSGFDLAIRNLNLSIRARGTLCKLGIFDIQALARIKEHELYTVRNCGITTAHEIMKHVEAHKKLTLPEPPIDPATVG